jgi:hypothetical protein
MPEEANDELPFVKIAAVCDRVLQEKDETLSLIRVIDRFILKVEAVSEGQSPPETMPSYPLGMNLVLSTIAGEARGRREILLRVLKPDGTQTDGPRV